MHAGDQHRMLYSPAKTGFVVLAEIVADGFLTLPGAVHPDSPPSVSVMPIFPERLHCFRLRNDAP